MPPIYHFTDFENLPGILEAGALGCDRVAPTAVDVGDPSIKDRRMRTEVPCGPGGMVCDYVPFYYAPRSPMLYRIKSGNVLGVSDDQGRLVYFVTSTETVYAAGLRCVLTDGNAATAITTFHDEPADLATAVDWALMAAVYWSSTQDDPDRRRRRMAEFLVHEAVPLELISEVGVYDADTQEPVKALIADAGYAASVLVRTEWYF